MSELEKRLYNVLGEIASLLGVGGYEWDIEDLPTMGEFVEALELLRFAVEIRLELDEGNV